VLFRGFSVLFPRFFRAFSPRFSRAFPEGFPCFSRGFSVLFSQLYGKCQGNTRKDGARPALILNFCVVLCIVCFVSYCVPLVCKCVLNYFHRVGTHLQLIKYISYIISYTRYVIIHRVYRM
jgi:hypothetical protein